MSSGLLLHMLMLLLQELMQASAMLQSWAKDANSHALRGMLWVAPPFPLIGAVINRLLAEQVNAIVLLTVARHSVLDHEVCKGLSDPSQHGNHTVSRQ